MLLTYTKVSHTFRDHGASRANETNSQILHNGHFVHFSEWKESVN